MDVLSRILKSVSLEGALFLNAEFTAPWCIGGRYGLASVRERLAGADHVVFFHFLLQGRCKVRLADSSGAIDVTAGDVVLFPRDDRHLLGSDLHLSPIEADLLFTAEDDEFLHLRQGGGGEATHFVCGYLACGPGVCRPLFESLPRLVRIPMGDGQATALLHDLLGAGVRESSVARPGGTSALAKLAELIVVEALRRYVAELPAGSAGWLAGIRDPYVGRALDALHREPAKPWTVDALAVEVGLSRSAFADRFASIVGGPPMQYLVRWRLALASRTLRSTGVAISRVAEQSGYASEAAFSRAFKREFGMPPAAWRRAGVSAAVEHPGGTA